MRRVVAVLVFAVCFILSYYALEAARLLRP